MDVSNATEEPALTVDAAVRTIERATGLEATVRRRTEGMTWMVWGAVTAFTSLFYAFADHYFETVTGWEVREGTTVWHVTQGPAWSAYLDFVWPMWILLGAVVTYALWHMAALHVPDARVIARRMVVSVVVAVAVFLLGWLGLIYISADLRPHAALALLGLPWLAIGAMNAFQTSRRGRSAMLTIGATISVLALASAPLLDAMHSVVVPAVELWVVAVGGGVPFIVGLWQTLRS